MTTAALVAYAEAVAAAATALERLVEAREAVGEPDRPAPGAALGLGGQLAETMRLVKDDMDALVGPELAKLRMARAMRDVTASEGVH